MLVDRGVEAGGVRRRANSEFFWFYDLDGNRFESSRPITSEYRAADEQAARES